jgi:site-specific recombinase XerD
MYKGDPNRKLKPHLVSVLRHFLFMCFTGLRISDFTDLTFDNITNNTLRLYPIKTRTKKKEMVKIPLNSMALTMIKDEGSSTGHLFNPITEQRMNFNLKDIAKIAGIKKPLSNHAARHTFATLFIQKTSDVATLQKLLGHSRIEETMVYVHISEENLKTQMNKFDQLLDLDSVEQKSPSPTGEGDPN